MRLRSGYGAAFAGWNAPVRSTYGLSSGLTSMARPSACRDQRPVPGMSSQLNAEVLLSLVVGARIVVDRAHLLDGIAQLVKLLEDRDDLRDKVFVHTSGRAGSWHEVEGWCTTCPPPSDTVAGCRPRVPVCRWPHGHRFASIWSAALTGTDRRYGEQAVGKLLSDAPRHGGASVMTNRRDGADEFDRGGFDGLLGQQPMQGRIPERDEAVTAGDAVDPAGVAVGEQRGEHTLADAAGLSGLVDDERLTGCANSAQMQERRFAVGADPGRRPSTARPALSDLCASSGGERR
jgi:hypothetical protein